MNIVEDLIVSKYQKRETSRSGEQSEKALEQQLLSDLCYQGYQEINIHSDKTLIDNLQKQISRLNNVTFTASEWQRFIDEYLFRNQDTRIQHLAKFHNDNYLCEFTFDNGESLNIKILDRQNLSNNILQVAHQVELHKGSPRYDVVIFLNGLPIAIIELKRRGESLRDAFDQLDHYRRHIDSLFYYTQLYIFSNGTKTKYYTNSNFTTPSNFQFTIHWSDLENQPIHDLEDFAYTFLAPQNFLQILTKYCVLGRDQVLRVLRPYQIAAVQEIIKRLWEIEKQGQWQGAKGGYIWHTTGSGKTLTSFQAAQLARELPFVEKVFFVVDRQDLDIQTIQEFKKFSQESIVSSRYDNKLSRLINNSEEKIIVTTIQKLSRYLDRISTSFDQKYLLIFDECHRSQFGKMHQKIRRSFPNSCFLGFTGTPIFPENAHDRELTTEFLFGEQLHCYTFIDAVRDHKVLKLRMEERPVERIPSPQRIKIISEYIIEGYSRLTNRKTFNALLTVPDIETACQYYQTFQELQSDLRITAIFSSTPPRGSDDGGIFEESYENVAEVQTHHYFMQNTILPQYNQRYGTEYDLSNYSKYYQDVTRRIKDQELDLVIVVGMLLTGFDAPKLNTLFVDRPLKHHGLIQAFSRTNRICHEVKKEIGNIVCFRPFREVVDEAFIIFNQSTDSIFIPQYDELHPQYQELAQSLITQFPLGNEFLTPKAEQAFCRLFNEVVKLHHKLSFYPEFVGTERVIADEQYQDYCSVFNTLKKNITRAKGTGSSKEVIDDFDLDILHETTSYIIRYDIGIEYILNLLKQGKRVEAKKGIEADPELSQDGVLSEFCDFETKYPLGRHSVKELYQLFFNEYYSQKIRGLIKDFSLEPTAYDFLTEAIIKKQITPTNKKLGQYFTGLASGEELDKLQNQINHLISVYQKYLPEGYNHYF